MEEQVSFKVKNENHQTLEEVTMREYHGIEFVKPTRMILNPDYEKTIRIIDRIYKCNGKCPCQPSNSNKDTRCPCYDFLENNICHCKLFVEEDQ